MIALIIKTISKSKYSLFTYITISAGMIWILVAMYPSFSKDSAQMLAAFQNYPEFVLKAFGIEMKNFFISIEGFFAGENYSFMWPIVAVILTISLGGSAISGEIEKGTIEILLAQPLSRTKIYLAKLIAGLAILSVFVFTTILSVVLFARIYHVDYQFHHHLTMAILGFLFTLAIYSISTMFSSMFSTKGQTASITAGIVIIMYALNLISAFKESLQNLKYLSFFHYFDYNSALLKNKIEPESIIVFLGVSILCFIVGLIWFNKRDVAV